MQVSSGSTAPRTVWLVIMGVSLCHLLNDVMQSLLAAIYPLLQAEFGLDFWQIGLMTFAFQVTASLLQPAIGFLTDRRPFPQSLPIGMGSTFCGLILLGMAESYGWLLAGAMLIGLGSAVFHPEASRVARLASGGRHVTAQSLFQVGGNVGSAIGPLLAALVVVPLGRPSIVWFAVMALLGMVILQQVGAWFGRWRRANASAGAVRATGPVLSRRRIFVALAVLVLLVSVKNVYNASVTSYYTFFLIDRFGMTTQQSQLMLFLFLASMAVGVAAGGPIADRFGTLTVIWGSIIGVLPFTLMLPHVDLLWTAILSVVIGSVMSMAFPAIVVFAQELVPGRIGTIAGVFFGFAFGMGGIGAAALGVMADAQGIAAVFVLCSFLPFLGLFTILLPRRMEMQAFG